MQGTLRLWVWSAFGPFQRVEAILPNTSAAAPIASQVNIYYVPKEDYEGRF